jgi:DNA-binding transcriptional regulator GbsR (MarR family)|tara:strand:+ start:2573 stop:2818 length:246 start_codon:yes stop_codon:yes gene_type:complete
MMDENSYAQDMAKIITDLSHTTTSNTEKITLEFVNKVLFNIMKRCKEKGEKEDNFQAMKEAIIEILNFMEENKKRIGELSK